MIYSGDCFELLGQLTEKSVDLVIIDPPYNQFENILDWDKEFNLKKFWLDIDRVIKPTTPVLVFGQEPFSSHVRLSNVKYYRCDWYWQKERPTNIMQVKRRPGKVIETISVFYKKQGTYNPQKTIYTGKPRTNKIKDGKLGILTDSKNKKPKQYKDDGTRYPLQIQYFKRDILKSNIHPTQKPLLLLEFLIKTYSNEGDTVLDCVAGSGTTGLAAKNLNRNYILIEKDLEYIKKIKERLNL